jgi:hypothetical protein
MVQKKNSCKHLGDEKKFVHKKIAQPPLKYLMVRPIWQTMDKLSVSTFDKI